jgi:hypothetical protein
MCGGARRCEDGNGAAVTGGSRRRWRRDPGGRAAGTHVKMRGVAARDDGEEVAEHAGTAAPPRPIGRPTEPSWLGRVRGRGSGPVGLK